MRQIVLDTETTGLSHGDGHKIVEIGCIELSNHVPTGNIFHEYLNPERDVPEDVVKIHGLTGEFLSTKPVFHSVAHDLLAFIQDSQLIIHNAGFDLGFLNAELELIGMLPLNNSVIDTVIMARKKYPGSSVSLDSLCRRFNIDNSSRTSHGALLDSELLAKVYFELIGGSQPGLSLDVQSVNRSVPISSVSTLKYPLRTFFPSPEELKAHEEFLNTIDNPIWRRSEIS